MKKDNLYFSNFLECVRIAQEAAQKLLEILKNYDISTIEEEMGAIHAIEHKGDEKKHEMMQELVKAFITPIDRDDIMEISHCIDNVTDSIEDILIDLYTWNIRELRPDVIPFADLVVRCCQAAERLLMELPDYKKSKSIGEHIIEINNLEEEGDRMYIQYIRNLSLENHPPAVIMAWREIYRSFENVCDCCEDVAEVIETIVIANT